MVRLFSILALMIGSVVTVNTVANACTVNISRPGGNTTLSGTVAVQLQETNCGGNFNRLEIRSPSFARHYDFIGTSYSLNTQLLPNDFLQLHVTVWSAGYRGQVGSSPNIFVTVSNGSSPGPTPGPTPGPRLSGAGCAPGSTCPPAPQGKAWHETFADEFNGTHIDGSKWYVHGVQCHGAFYVGCVNGSTAGITESGGFLQLRTTAPWQDNRILGGGYGPSRPRTLFGQRYGYFEIRIKNPSQNPGITQGAWWFPTGKASFPLGCGSGGNDSGNEEMDIDELINWSDFRVHTAIHDRCYNQTNRWITPGPNLSAGFHNYGLLWLDNHSAQGTFSVYVDGRKQYGPVQLDASSRLWANGIFAMLDIASRNTDMNNPLLFDWYRVYQAR